jgi:hypothetical protein
MEITRDTLPSELTVHVLQPACEPQAAGSGADQ